MPDQPSKNRKQSGTVPESSRPNGDSSKLRNNVTTPGQSPEIHVIDSLTSAMLLAFTGGSLDAFLYLNHGHVFAGVMTGNAVLCAVAVFNRSVGEAINYARPILAYVCGILLIAVFQRHVPRHSARFAIAIAAVGLLIFSFLPKSFPEQIYIFMVVLLAGFLVGIGRRVDTYAYNATVLTGSLRDATIALYQALEPACRADNLRKSRDLWVMMSSFFAGAAAGGLLGKYTGNHALWLPVGVLAILLAMVLHGAKEREQ